MNPPRFSIVWNKLGMKIVWAQNVWCEPQGYVQSSIHKLSCGPWDKHPITPLWGHNCVIIIKLTCVLKTIPLSVVRNTFGKKTPTYVRPRWPMLRITYGIRMFDKNWSQINTKALRKMLLIWIDYKIPCVVIWKK